MASNVLVIGAAVLVKGKLLARLCAVRNLLIQRSLLQALVGGIAGRDNDGRGQESGNAEELHLC